MNTNNVNIAIIGLGYVGLSLAVEFAKKRPILGFDTNKKRIDELSAKYDRTLQVSEVELAQSEKLIFSNNVIDLEKCNFYIITVPTPIDKYNHPNLTPLLMASEMIGKVLKPGDIVVYESTVYPGVTEEECVPVLERFSGLMFNKGFFVGYSPERINPGDKHHRVSNIKKITSGSTDEVANIVCDVYSEIVEVGIYKASSIRVAEAAKVIENTQRDVNIALINELAIIFNKLNIDTEEVLEAAGTKWNFMPFRPGLVGGHCIGVDPYYLTHKAESIGYRPEIILAGRRLNDAMAEYVASQLIKIMVKKKISLQGSRVLILGLAFKENCPDLRNTKVVNVINELKQYGAEVDVFDPWVDSEQALLECHIQPIISPSNGVYDGVLIAVAHQEFRVLGVDRIKSFCKKNHVLYDLKYVLKANESDARL